jgi:transposase
MAFLYRRIGLKVAISRARSLAVVVLLRATRFVSKKIWAAIRTLRNDCVRNLLRLPDSIARPDRDRPSLHRLAGADIGALLRRLRNVTVEDQRIVVRYEAGYDGFRLARSLAKLGIESRVLDPVSIQVNRRARRIKTDRIDALALLRALIAIERRECHVCAAVRVPSAEPEDARRSHKERQRLVRKRTGHVNRVKGLLFAQGIRRIEPKLRRTRIDLRRGSPRKVVIFVCIRPRPRVGDGSQLRPRRAAANSMASWSSFDAG